jgi:glycosyltransferase involved in cell wall biosynthesis
MDEFHYYAEPQRGWAWQVPGFDVLLPAMRLLLDRWPTARLLIAGAGDTAELEALAVSNGIGDAVMVLGERGDVPDLLAVADLAVLSSHNEGRPLALLEYMEAGKPIVATRVGGVPEIIDHGVHGVLVPPGSPEALAEAVDELLGHPERAAAMGARAQERRRRDFDFDVMIQRLEDLYLELWEAKAAGSNGTPRGGGSSAQLSKP